MKRSSSKVQPTSKRKEVVPQNSDTKWMLLIAALAIVSYGLSIANDYALDDFIVLVKNKFVQNGFAGIWDILSKDTFAGMSEGNFLVLKGGRYRPLSIISFAIENQFFGIKAGVSHFINVMLYASSGIFLFKFLKQISSSLLFCVGTSVLFITHPMHCESVINVKGRDDLMSLLFFLLATIYLFEYLKSNSNKPLIISLIWFFLCTMSKESGVAFVAVFPLLIYFFTNTSIKKNISTSSFYVGVAFIFILIRFMVTKDNSGTVEEDVLNNPFIHATFAQHYATVFLTWLMYLKLLILPTHFAYDYNFNQIPLVTFTDWRVILSLTIHISLAIISLFLFPKKNIYSFAILFYFITFIILSNLLFNIGAPLAERFMFIPSLGFCLVLMSFFEFVKVKVKVKEENTILVVAISLIAILYIAQNISRCPDWKNNDTLFITDVEHVPQSAKAQLNAGIAYLNLGNVPNGKANETMMRKAMIHLQNGITIYPEYPDGYLNTGVAYNWLGNYDSAEVWWNKARAISPDNVRLKEYDKVLATYFLQQGLKKGTEKKYPEAINYMYHAYRYDSLNSQLLSNFGGAYFSIQKMDSAKYFWEKTLQLNPNDADANNGLRAMQQQVQK